MNERELMRRLRAGQHANVRFSDFQRLLEAFGFELLRVRGSHQTYRHRASMVRLVVQPAKGQAKVYQLRQFLEAIDENGLEWMQR